jgi:RHS repeat-associated protein
VYGLTGLMSEFSTSDSGSDAVEAASDDRLQYRVGEQTGTAVMLMDSGGVPRENNRVFPFGEPWLLTTGSNNSEKFTTYQHDNDAGSDLDYAMARYYASRSGRFLTPDPGHIGANTGDPQSWNGYAYAGKDPINFADPDGLEKECATNTAEKPCIQLGVNNAKKKGLLDKLWSFLGGGSEGGGSPLGLGPCFDAEFNCTEGTERKTSGRTVETVERDFVPRYCYTRDPDCRPQPLRAEVPFVAAGLSGLRALGLLNVGLRVPLGTAKYGLRHILFRHSFNSGVGGVSKFSRGMGHIEVKALIQEAGRMGQPWRVEGSSRVLEVGMGRIIGTTPTGTPTSVLRVVTDTLGDVTTAYPIP